MDKTAIELFAGVGGFRVGLNHVSSFDKEGKAIENGNFRFLWANQWEPSTKVQYAYDCYNKRFACSSSENSNVDISKVNKKDIPDHSLLCGGFPCQDYSVAHSLSKEKGIEGKKGVLWWQIRDILIAKKTPFAFLENVDRLIKSPAKQRGRDFGIMLRCLTVLGYAVEWRVINAAEYRLPQRRRRTYIFAYRKNTNFYKRTKKFKGFKRISYDYDFINTEVRHTWEDLRDLILNKGLREIPEFKKDGTKKINPNGLEATSINFPKSFDYVVFVRGSGIDSSVKPCCIQGIHMYRQYIWIKGKYMVDRLKKADLI